MRLIRLAVPSLLVAALIASACRSDAPAAGADAAATPPAASAADVMPASTDAVSVAVEPGTVVGRTLDADVALGFVVTANVMGELEACG